MYTIILSKLDLCFLYICMHTPSATAYFLSSTFTSRSVLHYQRTPPVRRGSGGASYSRWSGPIVEFFKAIGASSLPSCYLPAILLGFKKSRAGLNHDNCI